MWLQKACGLSWQWSFIAGTNVLVFTASKSGLSIKNVLDLSHFKVLKVCLNVTHVIVERTLFRGNWGKYLQRCETIPLELYIHTDLL